MTAAEPSVACLKCRLPVEMEQAERRKSKSSGQDIYLHKECWERHEEEIRESERWERRRAEEIDKERRAKILEVKPQLASGAPKWDWCRVDAPEFAQRIRQQKLTAFAQFWNPSHGSTLLLAPSGEGKTAACIAALWRNIDEIDVTDPKCKVYPSNDTGLSCDMFWCISNVGPIGKTLWLQACDVANAQRRTKLGEEPTIIKRAKSWSLVVIDELGFESRDPDPVFLEVIDHRYRAQLPTVVTSGLTRTAFEARYGSAILRRLTEKGIGTLIDCHPTKGTNG